MFARSQPWYYEHQKFVGGETDSTSELTRTISWESNQRQIEQDHQVVDQARSNPNYKHPETESNIIHVLSRVHLDMPPKQRLHKLLEYICQGANLSEYNRDGELPLISFAGQRPDTELKVETELYIESLLNGLTDRGSTEVHMRNRLGQTALYCACVDGSHFSVKLLIARGSNVNARTRKYLHPKSHLNSTNIEAYSARRKHFASNLQRTS